MSDTFPVVMTAQGAQPTPPADLQAALIAIATSLSPGLTSNLPGSLLDDVIGTDTGALVITDQVRVDLINSLTPYGANLFLLQQLGQIYIGPGAVPAPPSNTSVFVVFSGPAGWPVAPGFTVSDGTFQYIVQTGGVIESGGASQPLQAIATIAGSWAVPANTVTDIVTSLPENIDVTVTNPLPGAPGGAAQTPESFRAQVVQAGLASAQGMPRFLRTELLKVAGTQDNLISIRQQTPSGWEIIVGGSGDPYAIGDAILFGLFDISTLTGSVLTVAAITKANPGVVTTTLNHGYTTGQVCEIAGATGMTAINGVPITATVLTPTTFSVGIDTTGFGTYTGNGVLTPNFRNVAVDLDYYPDTYRVPFVIPPQQTVAMTVTWNTTSPNFVSAVAIAQLANPALVDYINGLAIGVPINLDVMVSVFQAAVSSVLLPALLTRLVFAVSINGIGTAPTSGTVTVYGDPESYFFTQTSAITITQG